MDILLLTELEFTFEEQTDIIYKQHIKNKNNIYFK